MECSLFPFSRREKRAAKKKKTRPARRCKGFIDRASPPRLAAAPGKSSQSATSLLLNREISGDVRVGNEFLMHSESLPAAPLPLSFPPAPAETAPNQSRGGATWDAARGAARSATRSAAKRFLVTQPSTANVAARVRKEGIRKGIERRRGRLDAPRPCQRTLIVGSGAAAQRLAADLQRHFPRDFLLLGFVSDGAMDEAEISGNEPSFGKPDKGEGRAIPFLGTREELSVLVRRYRIDRVMFANCVDWQLENTGFQARAPLDRRGGPGLPDGPTRPQPGAEPGDGPSVSRSVSRVVRERRREVGDLYEWASSPAFYAPDSRRARCYEIGKRAFDIAFSLGALTATSPLAALVLPLVKFSSPGPIFYCQQRIGRGGAPFTIYKIRSMTVDAETRSGPMLSQKGDTRSTPVGKILRATKIDEMPQFWNVLKGDMSIVGPRPERPHFVDPFNTHIYSYALRHSVRPGLTGLAQIKGDALTHVYIKLHYDLIYVCHRSLMLDLSLLLRTPGAILKGMRG